MTERPLGERVAALEAVLPEVRQDLKEIRTMLERRLDAHDEELERHDRRLAALERLRWYGAGALSVIAAAAGYVIDWLRGK